MDYERVEALVIYSFISVLIVLVLYESLRPNTRIYHTNFYILDENGSAINYPSHCSVNSSLKLMLGIENHEGSDHTYILKCKIGNSSFNKTLEILVVPVEKGETRILNLSLEIPVLGNLTLYFELYKGSLGRKPYVYVYLPLNVTKP